MERQHGKEILVSLGQVLLLIPLDNFSEFNVFMDHKCSCTATHGLGSVEDEILQSRLDTNSGYA